jgi:hypothetical protein
MMQNHVDFSDASIFNDVSQTIYNALKKVYNISTAKTEITKTAFSVALEQLIK